MTKNDNDSLIQQNEEMSNDNQLLRDRCGFLETEIEEIRRTVIEELTRENQALVKEIEYLRQKVDITSVINSADFGSRPANNDEIVQRKNKEIYDLTVQLGCLKEENNQLKKDQDGLREDFQERLQ